MFLEIICGRCMPRDFLSSFLCFVFPVHRREASDREGARRENADGYSNFTAAFTQARPVCIILSRDVHSLSRRRCGARSLAMNFARCRENSVLPKETPEGTANPSWKRAERDGAFPSRWSGRIRRRSQLPLKKYFYNAYSRYRPPKLILEANYFRRLIFISLPRTKLDRKMTLPCQLQFASLFSHAFPTNLRMSSQLRSSRLEIALLC